MSVMKILDCNEINAGLFKRAIPQPAVIVQQIKQSKKSMIQTTKHI